MRMMTSVIKTNEIYTIAKAANIYFYIIIFHLEPTLYLIKKREKDLSVKIVASICRSEHPRHVRFWFYLAGFSSSKCA